MRGTCGRARQVDDRRRAGRVAQRGTSEPGGGGHDPVDAKLEQLGERRLLGLLLTLAGYDERRVRMFLEHGIEAGDELRQEQVVEIGHEDADRVRATADERPRGGVRAVAELPRRVEHSGAAGLADAGGVTEDAGDERLGHAGTGGDVVDRRGVHRAGGPLAGTS